MKNKLPILLIALIYFGCAPILQFNPHTWHIWRPIKYVFRGANGLKFQETKLHYKWVHLKGSANDSNSYIAYINGKATQSDSLKAYNYSSFLGELTKLSRKMNRLDNNISEKINNNNYRSAAFSTIELVLRDVRSDEQVINKILNRSNIVLNLKQIAVKKNGINKVSTIDSSAARLIKNNKAILTKLHTELLNSRKKKLTDTVRQIDSLTKASNDSTWLSQVQCLINPKADTIGAQTLSIGGASYNNVNGVRDNDPSGFSQYYVYLSLPLNKSHGIIIDSNNQYYCPFVWLRNLYLQCTYSPQAYKEDSLLSSFSLYKQTFKKANLVNRLDLLQYASLNVTMDVNILTWLITDGGNNAKQKPLDLMHIYFGPTIGFLATNVAGPKTLKDSTALFSGTGGIQISLKTEQAVSKVLTFELRAQPLFWISPLSSSIDPGLGPQLHNLSDSSVGNNSSKNYTKMPSCPYYYFSAKMSTNILSKVINIGTSTNTQSAVLYLSANVYGNYPNTHFYNNTYFQIQLGASLSIQP